jgi:hypothetical protein
MFTDGNILHRAIFAALTIATAQSIRLGYGNYSPLDDSKPSFLAILVHDEQGAVIRALWGLLIGSAVALPVTIGGYLSWWLFGAYVAGFTLLNYLVSKLRLAVWLCDPLVGAGIASIVFLL